MKPFNVPQLLDMLTYARPMGSDTERVFCRRFIAPLPGAYVDLAGNWHVKIDDTPILWSCHTDTVHRSPGRQTLNYDPRTGIVGLSRKSRLFHSCLGADDTAGVALLAQMAAQRIPGHYVFHYGEERGGIGSTWIAANHAEWLKTFSCAIAIDRKGYSDVITHQYGRCCSTAFAESLAAQLNTIPGFHYAPSNSGVFTDTANYTDTIGECTNLSVGYFNAHHDTETLHTRHVSDLFTALCAVDVSALTCSRTPGEVEHSANWTQIGQGKYLSYYRSRGPLDRECCECCVDYDQTQSTAVDADTFCSAFCEHRFYSAFLDDSHAQAQAAIRRQTFRKVQ